MLLLVRLSLAKVSSDRIRILQYLFCKVSADTGESFQVTSTVHIQRTIGQIHSQLCPKYNALMVNAI